ncbi:ABC transporter substrate-binding protein [Verminephrobacter aporrectodeae subsp. tuberculatae]|uniref:ABC transporter substrate-binding protein n=1 Tax=Verminephrobacter aporrectodeae TaxID=1110389 RepID=UPI002243586E|nr:ABC transporter substrate-binding protein [Verminephrobacter aporrectodeae]MCW8205779.1 ABC transporter substrate-binding protein [Verminephrobacter aporrectodeae subsp. tuberculatae]
MKTFLYPATALALTLSCTGANAAELRIGVLTTLSGAQAAPGVEMRDGIELAVKQLGGKVGGQPTALVVADDQFNPGIAKQVAERLVRKDKVQVLTGIIYSNVLLTAAPVVLEAGRIVLSSNAGPSAYAGEKCDPGFFNVSWQNDSVHEAAGKYATDKGYKRITTIAPNYPAGRDAIAGFKRMYKGDVVDEAYPKLGQLDFAVEIARQKDQKPDAVFFFLPGGMGANFIKQLRAANLDPSILLTTMTTSDQDLFAATGESMLGLVNAGSWSTDTDNAANKTFVAAFEQAYKRLPSFYAAHGYDAIMLLDAAVRENGGNVDDPASLRHALANAKFHSVRGDFMLGPNQFPLQDYHIRTVSRDASGRLYNRTGSRISSKHGDVYASACKMRK